MTRLLLRGSALVSSAPDAIVYNSSVAAEHHEALGYPPSLRQVIPNGFDLTTLTPDDAARTRMRQLLGLAPHEVAFGLFARFHVWKNHEGFLASAARLPRSLPFRLVFAGSDTDSAEFSTLVASAGLSDRTIALGNRSDILDLTRAIDVGVNLSHGEGFPNVVGEAMACEVPCIVSDVSDCRHIVGKTGLVTPPGDQIAAAEAMKDMVELGREGRNALGARARVRVHDLFDIDLIVRRYEKLYLTLMGGDAGQ